MTTAPEATASWRANLAVGDGNRVRIVNRGRVVVMGLHRDASRALYENGLPSFDRLRPDECVVSSQSSAAEASVSDKQS